MLPKITSAKVRLSFQLNDIYKAAFCTDIEAPGLIQYYHLLVVYELGRQPVLCVGAEWGRLDQDSENKPVLGYFDANGHANCGDSNRWCDESLFILQALKLAREVLQIGNVNLVEGETWALSEIQKKLDLMLSENSVCSYAEEYRSALSENRERLMLH